VRSWALELGVHNITAFALLPGDLFGEPELGILSNIWNQKYFETKAVDKKLVQKKDPRLGGPELDPEVRQMVIDHYVNRTALKQRLYYKDVVNPLLYYVSPVARFSTGESIPITGGNPAVMGR